LLAGRNITAWGYRALETGGAGLALLALLVGTALLGYSLSWRNAVPADSNLPSTVTLTLAALTLCGFVATSPVLTSADQRVHELINSATAAQTAGRFIEASDLYALVLGIDAQNSTALRNLAAVYQSSGRVKESAELSQRATAAEQNPACPTCAGLLRGRQADGGSRRCSFRPDNMGERKPAVSC
jgi:hypothetical protein